MTMVAPRPIMMPVPPGTAVVALAPARGRVVTVVDHSEDLGTACDGDWLLLLEAEGRDVALRIDTLPVLGDVDVEASAPPPHLDATTAGLLTGILLLETPVHVLDLEGLVGR